MSNENQLELTRRKALAGIGGVGVASAGAGLGTSAFFSDQQSFEDNSITAGELQLSATWQQLYYGAPQDARPGDYGEAGRPFVNAYPDENGDGIQRFDDRYYVDPADYDDPEVAAKNGANLAFTCDEIATFDPPSFAPNDTALIELDDVKPGDTGEVTFGLKLCDNPGHMWMQGELTDEMNGDILDPIAGDGSGITLQQNESLSATDLTDPAISPEDLAQSLVADEADVEIVDTSVQFVGDERAGGAFTGGTDVIGIDEGIILSSGQVEDVEGPNESPSTSTNFGNPGDADLDELAGESTYDAAILEFEFTVPDDAEQIFFEYVFGSEEYNEFVGAFNDVFGFFVNGENAALVPDPDNPGEMLPAAINNINNGQPNVEPTNPHLYVNNDPFHPDSTGETVPEEELADTEMDGFTVPLSIEADVIPGETNTMKLAIADAVDHIYDSWVLIEAGSLTTEPPAPPEPVELPDAISAKAWYDLDGDNVHDDDEPEIVSGSLRQVLAELSDGIRLDPDPTMESDAVTECFQPSNTHYIAFKWHLPTTVGNEVQGESVEFDLSFYTEQCRHNDEPEGPPN